MSLKTILMFLKFVTVLLQTRSFENDSSFKDRECTVSFIHDIRNCSLTWNYFIFELSTVWLQSFLPLLPDLEKIYKICEKYDKVKVTQNCLGVKLAE